MSVSAGRILPIPRGAYVAGTTYEMLDMVSYEGNGYIAKRQNRNVTPGENADWMLFASGGSVFSFKGRSGAIVPTDGDYSIEQITPTTGATEGDIPMVDSNGEFTMSNPFTDIYESLDDVNQDIQDAQDEITNINGALHGYKLLSPTQAQYDALQTKDANTFYFIKES